MNTLIAILGAGGVAVASLFQRQRVEIDIDEHAAMHYESIEDYHFWHWLYDHDFG